MNEIPPWRQLLCWGSVLVFVGTPPALLALQILDHLSPRDVEVAKSMSPMFFAISGVVTSLAGLNTYSEIKNGQKKHEHETNSQV